MTIENLILNAAAATQELYTTILERERGDGLTFPYGRRAKPSLFESVALQSCFTNNRSQQ